MVVLENIDIDIDIDKKYLRNIDIDIDIDKEILKISIFKEDLNTTSSSTASDTTMCRNWRSPTS